MTTRCLAAKTALVTGSSKGVGKGIALELARAGCDVAVHYGGDRAVAEGTVAEIGAMGGAAFAVAGDAGVASEVDAFSPRSSSGSHAWIFWSTTPGCRPGNRCWNWRRRNGTARSERTLKAAFCAHGGRRRMRDQKGGRIVNIGSGCNKIPFPNLVDYTASKGGIEMFTKVCAIELSKYNITVNCVASGAIEIERTKHEAGNYAETWAEGDSARPGRPAARCRAGGGGARGRGGRFRIGAGDLGRWRAIHASDLAVPVGAETSQAVLTAYLCQQISDDFLGFLRRQALPEPVYEFLLSL